MQSNKRPLLIAVTGTFGSGKSTFCKIVERTYPVIYSDLLAHEVLNDPDVLLLLTKRWGNDIVIDSKPDRLAIGKLVFRNKTELDFLNSIIHPLVLNRMQAIVNNSIQDILFFEIPLLFEARLESCFDHIVLVSVNAENRLQRVSLRSNISEEEINTRVKAQLPESIKAGLADTIITNDSTLAELEAQARTFLGRLPSIAYKSVLDLANTKEPEDRL